MQKVHSKRQNATSSLSEESRERGNDDNNKDAAARSRSIRPGLARVERSRRMGAQASARLIAPGGTTFCPSEILCSIEDGATIDFLRQRVKEIEGNGLEPRQRIAMLAAIQALEQVLRFRSGTLGALDQHHGTLERVPIFSLDSFQDGARTGVSSRNRNGSLDRG